MHTLSRYLERTRLLRTSSKLFIATVRPHGSVSKDTIGRWIKATLKMAGVDVEISSLTVPGQEPLQLHCEKEFL